VKLIGATQPVIDGDVAAKVARGDDGWHADVKVARGNVVISEDKGDKLAPVGAPPDLVYGGRARHRPPTQVDGAPPHHEPPSHPTFVANIDLGTTKVESKEVRGNVAGKLEVSVGGDEVGVVGNLWLDRGDLDLFDRRYQIERAGLHFDGSTDPILDIEISYDFPDVTTVAEVRGRASKPELLLSSRPASYSQAELLGFLLGGEPNGDPNNAPSASQRVTAAGTSYVANLIGGYVKKALPIDVDVLRYESATSTSSAAVTVGTWITHELFLAWRQRLAARPDENAGEGEIEYWLRRRLVIAGTVGDRGVNGVDLLWRRRW
jgi:translocation and assembly module TamB